MNHTPTLSPAYYDYQLQVFVRDGIIQDCAHPASMSRPGRPCCHQRRYAGRRAVDVPGHVPPPFLCPGCNHVTHWADRAEEENCPHCGTPHQFAPLTDPAIDAIRAAARFLEDPANLAPDHETRTKGFQIVQSLRTAERGIMQTYANAIRETYGRIEETVRPAPDLEEAARFALHRLADGVTDKEIADNYNGYNVIEGLRAALKR